MIPMLIFPAYNRHDLLLRLMRSIDVPVGRALIVDNGRNMDDIPELLHAGREWDLRVFRPPFASIGYGGALNFGILQTADAPWWLWASNDVHFDAGHLATVVDRMTVTTPRIITGGFTWGAINRAVINRVGLVDEHSFFPIYFDDNDYYRRCTLAGVEWIEDYSGWSHGDEAQAIRASATIKSDATASNGNSNSFPQNQHEYVNKWGGLPGDEVFTSPWNNPDLPLWATRPSVDTRHNRQW